jgi:hypothetical protein
MTRIERLTLLATFLFGVLGITGIGVVATRYVDHPQALPPLELPHFTPPPLPRFDPPPAEVARPTQKRLARVRTPAVAAQPIKHECGDDPLCGLNLGR